VSAGDGAKGQDEGDEGGPGGEGVGEQREGDVAGGQTFGHDAGAHDRAQQEGGREGFGGDAAGQRHEQQPGAQHAGALVPPGFTARMNALRNLPSTSGAMASTSMPWPPRKVRASSMS
jgi:hypothetical protein